MQSEQHLADLVGALRRAGLIDLGTSAVDRAAHSGDASLYRVLPQVVVRPRHTDELDAVLAVARSTGTSVTMRGTGTSIAGNAVGPGLLVDTRAHLGRVLSIDPEAGTALVEPGVVHADLQRQALAAGWRFGPDPSTHARCTVGGMIGNNACGSRALGYGRTADNVEALEVTWGTGARQRLAPGVRDGVAGELAALVAGDLAHVRTTFGRFSRQVSGYSLEHLLPERLRPERFVVGSEGTLAVVRAAELRLVREPTHRVLVVLGFSSMVAAADAVPALLGTPGMTACEGLDERIVRLVPSAQGLPAGRGWLLVEIADESADVVEASVARVLDTGVAEAVNVVRDGAVAASLWKIREDGAGLAARSLARPAHAGWEDAAVPPEHLGAWLRDFEALLLEHGLDGVPYGHFGDGCVHVRIDFTFDDAGASFRRFLIDCAQSLARYQGSLSGEHGDGRARSELLPLMYDARSIDLFGAVKAIADPVGLLNPGVLVDPAPLTADLRPARPVLRVAPGRLVADIGADAHRCTGVGKCVAAGSASSVMCPSWQATGAERDSTRGRARVLQEALDAGPGTVARGLDDPALHEALDLCLACKGCASDCPTGVDMAAFKAEALAARYAGRWGAWRRPRSHHSLGRLPDLLDSPLRGALRLARGSGPLAWTLKKLAGIDPRRSVPVPTKRPLRALRPPSEVSGSSVEVRGAPAGSRESNTVGDAGSQPRALPDVWIWADTFTDHFGAAIAHDAIEVLADAGLRAEVIDVRACCGLPLVSTGQLDRAARTADAAVAALVPYADRPIIGLEPSCLATMRSDLLHLSTDPRAGAVSGAMASLAEVLATRVTQGWQPPDLTGVRVVAQPHCHQHAVVGWSADEELLRQAGAEVVRVGGCCGLAGNFGAVPEHHEVSVAVAELQLLPAVRANPTAVVLADGMSCRTQLDDLAAAGLGDRHPVHLAQLLTGRKSP